MSKRHLFLSADGLVNKSIRGFIRYNPDLAFDEDNRVVFDTAYDKSKVSLVSGGGSGHEPAWTGYVGENMLAASVMGDIFASPSTKQILAAIDAVPSDKGTILVVTNYTGDCLHFGLANEKATAAGHISRVIICGDDVSIGKHASLVGRRGLAGQMGTLKVMGGAAGAGASLDEVYDLGVAVSQQFVSIAATLDHCHVPGRSESGFQPLAADVVELGSGPHNEPGHEKISPQPAPEEFVRRLLAYCLDESDPERGYVKFAPGDETALLVSNFGGISYLEMGALVDELLSQLDATWHVQPARVYWGQIETSLNAPAFSVSLVNITAAAAHCSYSVDKIKGFFDAKTTTHWESMQGLQSQKTRRSRKEQIVPTAAARPPKPVDDAHDLKVDPVVLAKMLRSACAAVVEAEPDITRWDTVLGDGDCGETLKTGATALLAAVDQENICAEGSVVRVLSTLGEVVESRMGGTLGGILGIFFVGLRNAIEQNASIVHSAKGSVADLWAVALAKAIEDLRRYTPAKAGDRTVMDTLIGCAEGMKAGGFDGAVEGAVRGAEATRSMKPRLGRATYVGGVDAGGQGLPPDPGAWGAMKAIQGLKAGL